MTSFKGSYATVFFLMRLVKIPCKIKCLSPPWKRILLMGSLKWEAYNHRATFDRRVCLDKIANCQVRNVEPMANPLYANEITNFS